MVTTFYAGIIVVRNHPNPETAYFHKPYCFIELSVIIAHLRVMARSCVLCECGPRQIHHRNLHTLNDQLEKFVDIICIEDFLKNFLIGRNLPDIGTRIRQLREAL